MSSDLQLETDVAMAQRPGQKQWPTDECATALKIPKASERDKQGRGHRPYNCIMWKTASQD